MFIIFNDGENDINCWRGDHVPRVGDEVCVSLGERAERLSGLCATGAYMLRDELRRAGLQATTVVARAVYGNAVHLWVMVEGLHADPTYLQFNQAQPWRVSLEAPPVSYHGLPCSWASEDLPKRWQRSQHPAEIYSLLGLGSWVP